MEAMSNISRLLKFQSTPSVGRATFAAVIITPKQDISIHALRGEGDYLHEQGSAIEDPFQSTPSVGRATKENYYRAKY